MPTTSLELESYPIQARAWPKSGRTILAQHTEQAVVVYQAYRASIARFAIEHGRLGGDFKLGRMTWIKPSFLWMMSRSRWGRAESQEHVLAIRLRREAFDGLLEVAVPSSFDAALYATEEDWKEAVARSDVRMQWDPDHTPSGRKCDRRAIQIGLRGEAARRYANEWIVAIEDISGFVADQRVHAELGDHASLLTPVERPYAVSAELARRLGMSPR